MRPTTWLPTPTPPPQRVTEVVHVGGELTLAERVARGAEFLDGKIPGWENKIDLSIHSQEIGYCCVIGQLFREQHAANPSRNASPYFFGINTLGLDNTQAKALGMNELVVSGNQEATPFWKAEIEKRLECARDSSLSLSRKVARGASLLDAKFPGWENKILLFRLNQSSAANCVIAQLFSEEYDFSGTKRLGSTRFLHGIKALGLSENASTNYGFNGNAQPPYAYSNVDAQKLWVKEIELRLFVSLKEAESLTANMSAWIEGFPVKEKEESYFPIIIVLKDKSINMLVRKPEDIPVGVTFTVIARSCAVCDNNCPWCGDCA